jgi:nicotinamide riboside kinase
MVLVLGQYSTGKTSFIRKILKVFRVSAWDKCLSELFVWAETDSSSMRITGRYIY